MTLALDDDVLDAVADLVLRLHQGEARRAGALLTRAMMRNYLERRGSERAGMRFACRHVLTALVLLGVVERPGA